MESQNRVREDETLKGQSDMSASQLPVQSILVRCLLAHSLELSNSVMGVYYTHIKVRHNLCTTIG